MKKTRKGLACLLTAIMVLTALPSGALAAEGDVPVNDTPVCTCETVCTADSMNAECPVCGAEGAAPENCGQYQAPEQNGNGEEPGDAAPQEPSAVETVQAMIDALPMAEELKAMDGEGQQAVYTDFQTAYDAYEALSDDEKQEVTGAEIMDALFDVFNGMADALTGETGDFLVTSNTGDAQNFYSFNNGVLTVNNGADITISMASDSATPTNNRIEIANGATASITLNGVNIQGTDNNGAATEETSAITLSSGSSLTLTLARGSSNILTGGSGGFNSAGAPAINVPEGTTLTVLCANQSGNDHICGDACGSLSATGGSSTNSNGGVGIGGGTVASTTPGGLPSSESCGTVLLLGGNITVNGGNGSTADGNAVDIGGASGTNPGTGGTVIILTKVSNSSDSLKVGGGSSGTSSADNGAGIKPSSTGDNTYEVYGNLSLPADLTIPTGVTVTIPDNTTLIVPSGKTLTNYGTVSGEGTLSSGGTFTNHGVVNVTTNGFNNNTVAGAFNITGGSSNTDYTYADGVLTVNNGANLTISMKDGITTPTSDRIVIAANAAATITLDGVDIQASNGNNAIDLGSGSKLTLILANGSTNKLVAGNVTDATQGSGVHVTEGTTLTIQCSNQENGHTCSQSCGTLTIESGHLSAGIGGKNNESCGTVTISGGVVTTTGNTAGIGGGDHGNGGNITITGGIVTSTGNNGAGIGGAGSNGPGGTVTITGGVVVATGAGGGAGIGGGWESAGGTVTITGGVVTATVASTGGTGAGIGGGYNTQNHGTFSTSTDSTTGNAVIFASSNLAGNEIGDDEDTSGWSGVIFLGTEGYVYGSVEPTDNFEVPSNYTLTLLNGDKLTIPDGITVTNNGTINLVDGGKISPENSVNGTIRQLYTVTFAMNGQGTAPSAILAVKDSKITQPDKPTAEGYTFDGWYKDADCTKVWDFTKDTVTSTTRLYARWIKNQPSSPIYYALLFETNGGNKINAAVRESGSVLDLSEYVPVRENYIFTGWYADAELTQPVKEILLDGTKTIYAGWTKLDTRTEQEIYLTVPAQERDLQNGSRTTKSKVCTLKLGFAVEDEDMVLTYETSDPEVATVDDGKITYQGVGTCTITVTAQETATCKEASLDITVKVGKPGRPTFTPTVSSRTAKKAFTVTSSTVRGVDGWEVQYSIRPDFWKATTKNFSNTGTKLYRKTCTTVHSKKTYYIHVRGYQVVDGEKVYSDWSPVKIIRTK